MLALTACGARQPGWTPVLEQTSTEFLGVETGRTREHLEAARAVLGEDPAAADAELAAAERSLRRLEAYYLPLLEARERATNAYRYFELGETELTGRQLDLVEAILLRMAEGLGEPVTAELEPPLEIIADARAALTGAPEQVPGLLESLAVRLHEMALKGDLVLSPE